MLIQNIQQLNDALKAFSPYETFFITNDGGCLCTECVSKERQNVETSIEDNCDDGWRVCAMENNYENIYYCDNCDSSIVGSYIGDDVVEWHETWERLHKLDANGATMFCRPSGHIDDIRTDISQMEMAIESIEEDNAK